MNNNDKLIEQARGGDPSALIEKLKTVPTSAGTSLADGDFDGDADNTWFEVLSAKLPESVMNQIDDALGC